MGHEALVLPTPSASACSPHHTLFISIHNDSPDVQPSIPHSQMKMDSVKWNLIEIDQARRNIIKTDEFSVDKADSEVMFSLCFFTRKDNDICSYRHQILLFRQPTLSWLSNYTIKTHGGS